MIAYVLSLIACHFVGDFAFQGEWMAANKGKYVEVLIYHAATYAATFVLFAHVPWAFALLLFLSHLGIDSLKATFGLIKKIWHDQLLHAVVIAIVVCGRF